ncbi:MAG: hypothetical protein HRU21_11600 [Pseudomonadales bacterium]|nr:hypothetical protein [Pseudomonadales bacterium]
MAAQDTIYTTDHKPLYWLLNKQPLSIAVLHPSNISKPFMLQFMPGAEPKPVDELQRLLAQEPDWIIRKDKIWYFDQRLENTLQSKITEDYQLSFRYKDNSVYKRIQTEALKPLLRPKPKPELGEK